MSVDVGANDPPPGGAPVANSERTPSEASGAPSTALAVPAAPAAVVVAPGGPPAPLRDYFEEGARAAQAYLRAQLSPRSRQNALDALRRLVRLASRGQNSDPEQFLWSAIGYEQATTIRAALYEMTRAGAITPGTANLTLSHLRGLLRAMFSMGLVTADQLALVHSGALKNVGGSRTPRGRALSLREEKALRASARALRGYRGAMLDTAIVVAIGAGLRREEVARLAVEGLKPGVLVVVGKGNKERRMPVDSQMQAVIDAWLEEREQLAPSHGGLFCSPQRPDWALSPWSVWALVRAAAHDAFGGSQPCTQGCKCLEVVTGPHDFRRTFATRLLDQGLDIRQVQVLMGHQSPETTARYDKRDVEALFEKRRGMKVIA